ncbi:uncharacterized protein EDB91DRAFT_1249529 [Suillus paluster]|uniref:uncharacterized protein n=1 Tax=Suillus paluster TaxID=48578 RepID=UPI001B86B601|nr:uncharacterized protein EDB91DRAFT_1249529 [Suillus paluster]KAG1737854.1 hypothetical protein EDB91DRAFT_1249529 [Suillus paluster]
MTWGVPYWTVSSSSTARPVLTMQTGSRNATQAEHRNEWEEVSPVFIDGDADVVSLDGSRTHDDMQVLHLTKLLDEAKQENHRFEEQVQSLLNQSMTETSSLQAKIAELRQRNKEALAECERMKKEKEDIVAALMKKNDVSKATMQQQNQEMRKTLEELNSSTAHAQAELLEARSSMLVYRRQLSQSSAQLESLRKEQSVRMSLTDRVAALEAELEAKDTELAEMKKLSSQAKSANAARNDSTSLIQEFNNVRALLANCIPERLAGMMSSSNEVVSALRKLNSDIHQDVTFMAESMADSFGFEKGRVNGNEETVLFQQVGVTIGAGLVHFLCTKSHSEDPILIQIAFQAYVSQYLCWLSTTWITGGGKERLGTADQSGTTQTVTAAWDALAHILSKHLELDDAQLCSAAASKIIAGLADILLVAGCNATRSQLCDALKHKFSEKISLLAKSGMRINRLVFDSACMDDGYDDGEHHKDTANNRVLCPTDIGLWQRSKGANGGMRILLKPKIALESVVDNLDD